MTRHIAKLTNDSAMPASEVMRGFLHLIRQVLSYSLDSDEDEVIDTSSASAETLLRDTLIVKEYLKSKFFPKLYVDTGESGRLEASIPLNKFILYHGPIGAGKTTTILKIKNDNHLGKSHEYLYYDIRRCQDIFERPLDESPESIVENVKIFRSHIYGYLYEKLCRKDPATQTSFSIFRFAFAPSFKIAFNDFVIRHSANVMPTSKLLDTEQSLSQFELFRLVYEFLLKEENTDQLLRILSLVNSEANLFNPVKEKALMFHYCRQVLRKMPVLFIDNVDAQPTNIQRIILISGIEISEPPNTIPVIASLRTTNLARLEEFGSDGAITIRIPHLPPVHISRDKMKKVEELNVKCLGEMLANRMDVLYELLDQGKLGFLKQAVLEIMSQLTDSKSSGEKTEKEFRKRDYDKYKIIFKEKFAQIRNSYVHEDIMRFCNYSIRAILVEYNGFVATHLYDSNISKLNLPPVDRIDGVVLTRSLRNYFYRWVTLDLFRFCDPLSETLPRSHNVFDESFEHSGSKGILRYPKLKLLEYLSKQPNKKTKYSDLKKAFKTFNVEDQYLYSMLLALERGASNSKLYGLIQIESFTTKPDIPEMAPIGLTEAGAFFLEKLTVSIEYLLWMGLYTDVNIEFRMPRKYSIITLEKEKLKFLLQFLRYLAEEFSEEFGSVKDSRYQKKFKLEKGYYLERVYDSIFAYKQMYWNRPGDTMEIWQEFDQECIKIRNLIKNNEYL